MISFIGYYNYTVILTYISLFCSIAGMLFTVNGWYKMAVLCLALSGLCDMFDGKIARRKTDRTDDEKCFGIQSIHFVIWSASVHFRSCWHTALVCVDRSVS